MPNISCVSRSCHEAPAYTPVTVGSAASACGTVVRSSRRRAGVPRATTWAQTRKPVPGSSTALSQSKNAQPSSSRAVRSASGQAAGGTSTVSTS